jgi:LmbE family N-acetylglucosaminyl deacetylase
LNDIHQDHVTVAQEAVRAFKKTNIWAYELPWNCLNFNTAGFVRLGILHVDAKVLACKEYKTQADRPYMQPDAIEAQARMRGTQIGVKYAEAFEIIRQVI